MHIWNQAAVSDNVTGTSSLCRQKPRGQIWISATDLVLDVLNCRVTIGAYPTVRRDAKITLSPQLPLEGSIRHTPTPEQQPIRLEDDLAEGCWLVVHSDDYAGNTALPGMIARS